MSKTQEHQAKDDNSPLMSSQRTEDQSPVHDQEVVSLQAFQRATRAPAQMLRPSDVMALQGSVGNRAVQRLVEPATSIVQRDLDESAVMD